jgi:hypothetical protein
VSTYEILDVIADAYNPILLVVLLLFISRAIYQRRWVEVEMLFSSSVVGLGFVYLIMFVDNNLSIWGSIGLDYSTHTAFAISIVTVLIIISKSYSKLLFVSLVFYIMLELYQKYHSIMDIVTTSVVILLLHSFIVFMRMNSLKELKNIKNGI